MVKRDVIFFMETLYFLVFYLYLNHNKLVILALLETSQNVTLPREVPNTRVGHESMRAVRPLRKIWWRKRTVSELRKMELMSSCEHGGLFEEAAILKGLRKQEMRISSCSTYSSSASTIRNTKLD